MVEEGFTLKRSNGFSLIEVLTSLLLLGIVVTVLIPVLTRTYQERVSIEQERMAMYYLNEVILDWLEDTPIDKTSKISSDIDYQLKTFLTSEDKELKVCIQWKASNSRNYERCEQAKKK